MTAISNGENGNRTHEPNLRELTAELDGLETLTEAKISAIRELLNERDRLYKERDEARKTAVDAALKAADEKVVSAFAASEKAIVKSDQAQDAYNVAHNGLLAKMDEQHKDTLPRFEANSKFEAMAKDIQSLRESRSEGAGGKKSQDATSQMTIVIAAMGVNMILSLIALAALVVRISQGH